MTVRVYGLEAIEQAAVACKENTWFDLLGEKFYVLSVSKPLDGMVAFADIELCQVRRKDEKHF